MLNRRSGKDVESKLRYGLSCRMNKGSRMRSLNLSGEKRICGLLKSTSRSVLDRIWFHTSEVSLV